MKTRTFTTLMAATVFGASGAAAGAFELASPDIRPNGTIAAKHV